VHGWRVATAAVEGGALLAARPLDAGWSEGELKLLNFAGQLLTADGLGPTPGDVDAHLAADLREALREGQLLVLYQPEVDLWSRRVIAAEALVRWEHPTLGLLDPSAFIPVAEQSELIQEVGTWVLRAALDQLAHWSKLPAGEELMLRVNVSPAQISRGGVVGLIAEELRERQLAGGRVCVEITESVLPPDFAHLSDTIEQLRALGVSTAIDDWGTGFSRLQQLRLLRVDTVKLDRSYVSGVDTDERAAAIIRALVGLARSLDLVVIAEGVETEGEASTLLSLGCTRAQGHLFGPALAAEQFEQLLADGTAEPVR
jgi:EAL domain-containing protein (putative c-di-GMP-specific phosphodiesterase class I)